MGRGCHHEVTYFLTRISKPRAHAFRSGGKTENDGTIHPVGEELGVDVIHIDCP